MDSSLQQSHGRVFELLTVAGVLGTIGLINSGSNNGIDATGSTRNIVGLTSEDVLACPTTDQGKLQFSLPAEGEWVVLQQQQTPQLCTLSVLDEGNNTIPMARTYDGHSWERVGGALAQLYPEWDCIDNGDATCTTWLPEGQYTLQNRPSSAAGSDKDSVARFLETASFGVTPDDLEQWDYTSSTAFADYLNKQMYTVAPTSHRTFYRTRMNPSWRFHKPEFAANLDPCAPSSTWRRTVLNVKDLYHKITVTAVGDGNWRVEIGGHVRAILPQLRFVDTGAQLEGTTTVCGSNSEIRTNIHQVERNGRCQPLVSDDLLLDFPDNYKPPSVLSDRIPALNNNNWLRTSDEVPNYLLLGNISPDSCKNLPTPGAWTAPVFAQTTDGIWLVHDPRIVMQENSVTSPLDDGGVSSWKLGATDECSNVRRTFQNEASCRMSSTVACRAGVDDLSQAMEGLIVCGSHGEVSNDPTLGDGWMDIPAIDGSRAKGLNVPMDSTGPNFIRRQRVLVWNTIALQAQDQLRQRVAWALLQIFALPQSAIGEQQFNSEAFMIYCTYT